VRPRYDAGMDEYLSQALAAIAVVITAVVGWREVAGDVRSGVTRMAGVTPVRRNNPVWFWFYVSMRGAAVAACLWLLANGAFQVLRGTSA
jgi:hypothetical protein